MTPEAVPPGAELRAVVVIDVGGTRVALDAEVARGVARPEAITELRGPEPALWGLLAVHGKVAAVVDPRPALGVAPLPRTESPGGQVLVVSSEAGRFAILVDDLDVESGPLPTTPATDGAAASVRRSDGAHVTLVDVRDLVGPVLADDPTEAGHGPGAGT